MFYEVIPEGKVEALTYDFDSRLMSGQIVLVPVGKRVVPGVVVKKVAQPDFKTRAILKVLYSKPLPAHLLKAVSFISKYYLAPSGQALSVILPRGIEKKRRKTEHLFGSEECLEPSTRDTLKAVRPSLWSRVEGSQTFSQKTEQVADLVPVRLNEAQKNALEGLYEAPGATRMLHGVTGSGKTNIYVKMASRALSEQKSVVLLVPEIALTGQLVRVFREYFGEKVVLIHSKQTEAERHLIFERILSSEEPLVVVGPRSALFAPVARLGLIIIDEAHENTYFQENPPRYSAIRVASYMASVTNGAMCVLGSATPTVVDYYIADKRGSLVSLKVRAKEGAKKAEIKIADFKDRGMFSRNKYFCNALLQATQRNLTEGRQTLIFHNRRGSSPLTICENCGEELLCPNCYLPLTLHTDNYELVCHTCGFHEKVPSACPKCGGVGLVHKGFGTKLLETELRKQFPKARIRRFDADNKKDESLEAMYTEVRDGEVDIMIGTQTVAKGLDLPRLSTVGVVQADAGLSLPDFMAEERTFQLLTQVIGRVGRGHCDTAEVFIQTFRPEHPVISFAVDEDYVGFYRYMIRERRKSGFPPFCFLAKLEITLKTEAIVVRKVREAVSFLASDKRLVVSPPYPAFHERTARGYTWEIIVRSRSREALVAACSGLDKNFKVTLDPPSLL